MADYLETMQVITEAKAPQTYGTVEQWKVGHYTLHDKGFGANPQVANYFEVTLDAIENRMGTEPHHSNWIEVGFNRFPMELGKLMTNQQSIRTTLNNMAQAAARATETL